MGVKKLTKFIQDCPDACKGVLIEEMATRHQRSSNCNPVLVVDGSNFISWLYTYKDYSLECIYGGQWIQFKEFLDEFISKFETKGINLVFIFDGTINKEKHAEWAKRRTEEYKNIASFFNEISQNCQVENITIRYISPTLKLLAKFALKELHAEMYQTDKDLDADNYIANYANENPDVFAILSSDSDFIIFDTKPVLSIYELDLHKLETLMYNRYCFAERYLNLSTEQLPLFACLMGNDYIQWDNLIKFRNNLFKGENFKDPKGKLKIKVKKICDLIKKKQWNSDFEDNRNVASISNETFCNAELIKRGLESYAIKKMAPSLKLCTRTSLEFHKAVHDRHYNSMNVCIYNILCKKEYGSSEVLEDGSMPPSALVYRPIRQRCYGILFNCSGDPDNMKATIVEERCWYKKSKNEENNLNVPERIQPLPLLSTSDVIKIEDLWFNSTEEQRFKYFWHILQIKMEFDILMKLPKEHVALACILNYLIGGYADSPLLKPLDVAVFVAQALWKPTPNDIKVLESPPVDALVVNLSSLFVNGMEPVLMALETCGFPDSYEYVMPWKFFDGKLFHYLHAKARKDPRVRVLCKDKDEKIEEFYRLLSVVTNQTEYRTGRLDWKTILNDFQLEDNPKP